MLDELRELYQEIIIEHSRTPRNKRHPEDFNREAVGKNPMCGDALVVYLKLGPDGLVEDCAFMGEGCAISMASASMMTDLVKGKTGEQAEKLFAAFKTLATSDDEPDMTGVEEDDLDQLRALAGVRQFPIRVKCATLAWHTMHAAVEGRDVASTE